MNRIREVMKQRNLTFDQVASAAGVSVRTVYNAADGMKSNRSTKKLIARALRSPVDYIWPSVAPSYHCSNSQTEEAKSA